MADVPFTVGPFQPSLLSGGDDFLTMPDNSSPSIIRSVKLTNVDPNLDAWFDMAAYDTTFDYTYKIINGLHVPAGTTKVVPLDLVFPADSDVLMAQQHVDQSLSSIVCAQAAGANSSTDTTSYTTGSYTMTAGEVYVAFAHVKNAAGTYSMSGTHTSETWTQYDQARVNGGGNTLDSFACLATATSSGTTTFSSTSTLGGCILQVIRFQNMGSPSSLGMAVDAAGHRNWNRTSSPWMSYDAVRMCGSRLLAAQNQQNATGFTFEKGFTEIAEANMTAENVNAATGYARSGGNHGEVLVGNPGAGTSIADDSLVMMMDVHDQTSVLWCTVDGVHVT